MANAAPATGELTTQDGVPLKQSFARAERAKKIRAFLLVLPLLAFIFITFIYPIAGPKFNLAVPGVGEVDVSGGMIRRSYDNGIVGDSLPNTLPALADWTGWADFELPDEEVFRHLWTDIKQGAQDRTINRLGQRLNYDVSGMSSLIRKTARKLRRAESPAGDFRAYFVDLDKKWGQIKTWRALQYFGGGVTAGYYQGSFDMQFDPTRAQYDLQDSDNRIHIKLFIRTIVISAVITFITLLLGYPVAFLLSRLPLKTGNVLMILVLMPFWTSLLVRTTSWIVLLQEQGIINDLLVYLGLLDDNNRLIMMNNLTGTIIAMSHILLPFMILPLYSVMKTISPAYMKAACSLGATPARAFWRIYFPQTVPGIGAGAILVFILSIGYYITPAIVGGTDGVFISNRIAYHVLSSLNWGLAAALGTVLLVLVLALYWVYDRVVGIDNMKLG